jgi:hypothetical protein
LCFCTWILCWGLRGFTYTLCVNVCVCVLTELCVDNWKNWFLLCRICLCVFTVWIEIWKTWAAKNVISLDFLGVLPPPTTCLYHHKCRQTSEDLVVD